MYEEAAPEALGLEELEELETIARDVSTFIRRINSQEDFMKNKSLQNSLNKVSAKSSSDYMGCMWRNFAKCMHLEFHLSCSIKIFYSPKFLF